jgi:hypothetical protein
MSICIAGGAEYCLGAEGGLLAGVVPDGGVPVFFESDEEQPSTIIPVTDSSVSVINLEIVFDTNQPS